MTDRAHRVQVPIAAIAVAGLATLVALAVGVSLFLGLSSATENTRQLIAARSEALVDMLERRIESQLQPVMQQAQWAVEQIELGNVSLDDTQALDTFILGALSTTPQVAGIGIVDRHGRIRRWGRFPAPPVVEDWSNKPETIEWLDAGKTQTGSRWRPPFWTHTLGTTVVLHDAPIRIDGEFAGMFAQVVTISDLSLRLASTSTETGVTPFILYDRDHVLAHPLLIAWAPAITDLDQPLVTLEALGDTVLERIWSPDEKDMFILRGLTGASASGVSVGDDYHVFLYRDIHRYGSAPWTIGAYVNTGKDERNDFERLMAAMLAGLAVLVVSVVVAMWLGARASRPIQAIAAAARSIETERFDEVPVLPPSRVAEFDDANRSFNRMVAGLRENKTIRETLGRFVPTDVARTLLSKGGELAPEQSEATVLFCDLEGFTALTETLGPAGIFELLNEYFETMVAILESHHGVVTQFQGDAILATFNVPVPDAAHAANALRAAMEMQAATRCREFAGQRIGNRIGVNTGRLVAGAVGAKGRSSYTVHGDAVNLAARLEALNKDLGTRILVSEATAARVEGFDLEPIGEVAVRGRTGRIAVFTLGGAAP